MIRFLTSIMFLIPTLTCQGQVENLPKTRNPDFSKKIQSYLDFSIPLISIDELKKIQNKVFIIDTREREEFEVSHMKGAHFGGYKHFEEDVLKDLPKDTSIVVYCSIGYRSEKIGEKLQTLGFKNVKNLYGSIFEWVNQGNTVVGQDGKPTRNIHTYNKSWSKWVVKGKGNKQW